jgi:transcriptional regulator with XRE-family HTH domain
MAGKYKNLAAKIQKCRTRAKYSQEKLAKMFGITRTAVTQWESKDPKNRTEPNSKQLTAIANLHGKDYWWYLAWFMDDEVEADRGVDYNHLGQRIALEPLWSDAELQEIWAQMRPAEDWQQAEPEGWFADALRNSNQDGLEIVRRRLQDDPPDREGSSYLTNQDNTPTQLVDSPSSLGAQSRPEGQNTDEDSQAGSRLAESTNPAILRRSTGEFQDDEVWRARSKNFKASVEHRLARYLPQAHKYLEVEVWTGSLRSRADYFDGAALIEFRTSRWKQRGGTLFDGMGRLLLTERMLNRSVSKMLVICIDVADPERVPRLSDEIIIAKSMGFDLIYANPDQDEKVAEEINKFIRNAHTVRPRTTTKGLLG